MAPITMPITMFRNAKALITLILIPTLYLVLGDFQTWWKEAKSEVCLESTPVFSAKFRR